MRTTLTLLLSFFCWQIQAQDCNILYVNANAAGLNTGASWADAYTGLQDALTAASACPEGAEIWVAQGTYYPEPGQLNDSRDATFRLLNNVALYGGFAGTETERSQRDWAAHPTILSGDIGLPGDSTDNCYTVVTAIDVDSTALLDGFVIRDGNADGDDGPRNTYGPKNAGAGLYNQNGALRISNCLFEENMAFRNGGRGFGAIYNNGTLTMENCIIKGNLAVSLRRRASCAAA